MNLNFVNNPAFKKGMSIATAVAMGIGTVVSTLSDQKKEKEFEEMKKTLEKLQNK